MRAGLSRRVFMAMADLDLAQAAADHNRPTRFWRQCARDTQGLWVRYADQKSAWGVPYFHGKQEMYKTPQEHKYLLAHLDARRAFYDGLLDVPSMELADFRLWLETLRCLLEYRKQESTLHEKSVTDKHTEIVREQVIPLAKKYHDPYATGAASGPVFAGFPKASLPYDETKDGRIYHHYPSLDYTDEYLGEALDTLKEALREDEIDDREAYIRHIAYFFQVLINLHLFAAVNSSLYMNLCDGLLEIGGLEGVEHGILDFVAFRFQPETFQDYFYDSVINGQRQ